MSYAHGAEWCLKRGMHSWRPVGGGLERCSGCLITRDVLYGPDDTIAVNDLIPRHLLPEHARIEAEVDDLNEFRRYRRRH
jgi:hypothetical protein